MIVDPILSTIGRHISLNASEKDYFLSLLIEQHVNKKQFVLKEGQLCTTINFVNDGLLRAFYINKEGRESTVMFALTDWWITDMHAFANHRRAMLNIQAIDTSQLLSITKDDLDNLFLRIPKFERFFRIILQNAYIREQLRTIQNLSLPAEERYAQFLTKYPQIVQRVTQKQIASYLGITPEFLSTIRANKSNS